MINDMEKTIKQTYLQTLVLAAIMSLMLMAAACFCTHITRSATVPAATTLQWVSDTAWTGGWR